MRALLLAAGAGTRLRPFTDDRPKPMVPIGDAPIIAFALTWLRKQGVTEVAINLHYKPERLVEYVGTGERFGVRAHYSPESRLLGSAGALVPLRDFFRNEELFVVLYGDVLTDYCLDEAITTHRSRLADLTLVLTNVEDPTRAGIADLEPDGRIIRFVEKPTRDNVFSSLANAGIYLCSPRVLDFIVDGAPQDFGFHVIPAMIAAGARVFGAPTDAVALDVGSPERMRQATRLAAEGVFSAVSDDVPC